MAKPRKQKTGEQTQHHKHAGDDGLIGGEILHQKICLSIDVRRRKIFGYTDIKVIFPENGVIGLHADNMVIENVLVNGELVEFEYFKHYKKVENEQWESVTCVSGASEAACAMYISSLDREILPNLLISCRNPRVTGDDQRCQTNGQSTSQNSSGESKPIENGADEHDLVHEKVQNTKFVRINYSLESAEADAYFSDDVLYIDNQIRRSHCWFPCIDSDAQRIYFDLELTVDPNFVAVSTGRLLYQILTDDIPPRKTFVYNLSVPVSAGWISLAVAPFGVFPDSHKSQLSYFCLPKHLTMLRNTIGFFHAAFSHYEEYLSVNFPFGSYMQVFVPSELLSSSVSIGASMCVISSDVLFDEKVVDQIIDTRIKLAYALARQWFGGYIIPESPSDEWLMDGLAGFLTDSYIRRFLGNNEARYRRYKANCSVCQVDITGATALSSMAAAGDLYGTQTIGLYGKIRSWKAVAVLQMLEKQMGPESFRKILQIIVYRAQDEMGSFRALSTKEFRHLANKVGNLERPFLKEFFPRWVDSCGCPILRLGISYVKRKNMIELAAMRGTTVVSDHAFSSNIDNEKQDTASWPGMMSIRVHELDGVYDHPSLPMSGESLQLLEIQLHSRLASKRFQKPKKVIKPDGSEDNADMVSVLDAHACLDSPLLWIRVDPEMEYLSEIHFHQPVQMWINQLEKDRDVVAQSEAISILKSIPQISFAVVNALNNLLNDSKAFWRVRIEAAFALAYFSSKENDGAGLVNLVRFYKNRRFDTDIGLPKPNNFQDVPEYFVLEAIPLAIAMVRAEDGKSPREAVEFILQLLKYNDNNGNPYSDVYWLASLIQAIGDLELGQQSLPFLPSLLKCIDRLLQFDRLMPGYNGILTISCIHTLAQFALKMQRFISSEHISKLIQSFRNFEQRPLRVRIEATKSLLNLEFYAKGLDATLVLFVDFVREEPSVRGQVKLARHMMRLCHINSECQDHVKPATLQILLHFLASRECFNNVILRHHIFCILQVVAGRPPTLYAVPRVHLQPISGKEPLGDRRLQALLLRNNMSASSDPFADAIITKDVLHPEELTKENVLHPEEHTKERVLHPEELTKESGLHPEELTKENVLPAEETTKDDVLPAEVTFKDIHFPAAEPMKEAETVSNSTERRVLKIRVRKPSASGRADETDNVMDFSRVWREDVEVGPASSVSVDAPPKVINETLSTCNQMVEEVYSCRGPESRITASVGSAKVASNEEIRKELQCTADSRNSSLPEDRSSPIIKEADRDTPAGKSANLLEYSAKGQYEETPLVSFAGVESQDTQKKEKKHKEKKRKREDKGEHHYDDPEYLERKRMKKERRRMEKEMAQTQTVDMTRSTPITEPTKSMEMQKSVKTVEYKGRPTLILKKSDVSAGPSVSKGQEAVGTSSTTKVRIKIKSRTLGNV